MQANDRPVLPLVPYLPQMKTSVATQVFLIVVVALALAILAFTAATLILG